jgi:hypothetical protein
VPAGEDEFIELDEEGNLKKRSGARRRPQPPKRKAAIRRKPGPKVIEVEPAAAAETAVLETEDAAEEADTGETEVDRFAGAPRRPAARKTGRKPEGRAGGKSDTGGAAE